MCPQGTQMMQIDNEYDMEISSAVTTIKSCFLSRKQEDTDALKADRSVHFEYDDETDNVPCQIAGPLLVPSSEMTDIEKQTQWWQPSEYNSQKATAKNIAKAIQKREPCDPKGNPSAYSNVVARVFSACLSTKMKGPTEHDLEKLAHWTRVAHSRRGLERWSIPQVSKIRKECRLAVIDAVLDMQYENPDGLDWDELWEVIRMSSERLSKASKLYALAMAFADHQAARDELQEVMIEMDEKGSDQQVADGVFKQNNRCVDVPSPEKGMPKDNVMLSCT